MIRVGIVNESLLLRAGLRATLESCSDISVVAESAYDRAVAMARHVRPDVIVSSDRNGSESISLLGRLKRMVPLPAVLAVAEQATAPVVRQLITHGVAGILLQETVTKHLAGSVLAAAGGAQAFAREVTAMVIAGHVNPLQIHQQWRAARERMRNLSSREHEVLVLIAAGLPNRAIGEAMGISPETVKDHVRAVFVKLCTNNRISAARIAWQAGAAVEARAGFPSMN